MQGNARADGPVWPSLITEATRILSAIDQGDPQAARQLFPLVDDELRNLAAQRLAEERPGQTLQTTALVHEAYLRLVDVERAQNWNSRGHFFAAASEAMRRILVDHARRKKSLREPRADSALNERSLMKQVTHDRTRHLHRRTANHPKLRLHQR
jgi:RNA polymerase sigma factor (TIGR02999 family)